MFKNLNLDKFVEAYFQNKNISIFLRKNYKNRISEDQIIKTSYDLQAGNYIKIYDYNRSKKNLEVLINEINKTEFRSILDFGCGELTSTYTILKNLKNIKNKKIFACDLSLLRIYYGVEFLKKKQNI